MYFLFPFSRVQYGSSIILYGAGKNGIDYFRQLQATRYCSVKYAVDMNWEIIHHATMKCFSPEKSRKRKIRLLS